MGRRRLPESPTGSTSEARCRRPTRILSVPPPPAVAVPSRAAMYGTWSRPTRMGAPRSRSSTGRGEPKRVEFVTGNGSVHLADRAAPVQFGLPSGAMVCSGSGGVVRLAGRRAASWGQPGRALCHISHPLCMRGAESVPPRCDAPILWSLHAPRTPTAEPATRRALGGQVTARRMSPFAARAPARVRARRRPAAHTFSPWCSGGARRRCHSAVATATLIPPRSPPTAWLLRQRPRMWRKWTSWWRAWRTRWRSSTATCRR